MKYLRLAIIILIFNNCSAQLTNYSNNINKDVENFKNLLFGQKFQELSNFASPKLIAHLNSKEDVEFLLSNLYDSAEQHNTKITELQFGKHSDIIQEKNELQCSIPLEITIENPDKKIVIKTALALISVDNGNTWLYSFIVDKDPETNNKILGLNEQINLPKLATEVIKKQ